MINKDIIKKLCTTGAFQMFIELMEELELPMIRHGDDLTYQVGKRDGAVEFKQEVIKTIDDYAKN